MPWFDAAREGCSVRTPFRNAIVRGLWAPSLRSVGSSRSPSPFPSPSSSSASAAVSKSVVFSNALYLEMSSVEGGDVRKQGSREGGTWAMFALIVVVIDCPHTQSTRSTLHSHISTHARTTTCTRHSSSYTHARPHAHEPTGPQAHPPLHPTLSGTNHHHQQPSTATEGCAPYLLGQTTTDAAVRARMRPA